MHFTITVSPQAQFYVSPRLDHVLRCTSWQSIVLLSYFYWRFFFSIPSPKRFVIVFAVIIRSSLVITHIRLHGCEIVANNQFEILWILRSAWMAHSRLLSCISATTFANSPCKDLLVPKHSLILLDTSWSAKETFPKGSCEGPWPHRLMCFEFHLSVRLHASCGWLQIHGERFGSQIFMLLLMIDVPLDD